MRGANTFWMIFGIVVSVGTVPPAFAYGERAIIDENQHALSLAAGIASPAMVTSLSENPAGLHYNSSTKFQVSLATHSSAFNPFGLDGHFFTGNGWVGAGIGVATYNQFVSGSGSLALLDFGLGAEISALNMAVGIAGQYTLGSAGNVWGTNGGTTWGGNIGLLFNPRGPLRIGITGYQVLAGLHAIGAGVAYELNPWADFAVDGTLNPSSSALALKPELGIHLSNFQMNVGYGFQIVGSSWTWLRTGLSFAVGFHLNYNLMLQAYYNHLALWAFGATIRL